MINTLFSERPESATVKVARANVQNTIDRVVNSRDRISVLEAGCGSCNRFDLGMEAYVVGIDISNAQLERNDALDEKICADIETFELPTARFDLVFCWYVLEHLRHPEDALARLSMALRKDGLLVISVPCVWSLKGLATKFTPHWVHIFVYRWLLGRRHAGRDDRGPFPTYLRWSTRPSGVRRFAQKNDLAIEFFQTFEDFTQHKLRREYKIIRLIYKVAYAIAMVVSVGRYNIYLTDYAIVLRKSRGV